MGKVQSKPMLREMLTISCVLDELVGGQVLQAADLLAQRLKSLELMAAGATAEVATQVEIVPKELTGLATQAESRLAKKEATADLKLSRALKGKGRSEWTCSEVSAGGNTWGCKRLSFGNSRRTFVP